MMTPRMQVDKTAVTAAMRKRRRRKKKKKKKKGKRAAKVMVRQRRFSSTRPSSASTRDHQQTGRSTHGATGYSLFVCHWVVITLWLLLF